MKESTLNIILIALVVIFIAIQPINHALIIFCIAVVEVIVAMCCICRYFEII